jgi:hypothetical protein
MIPDTAIPQANAAERILKSRRCQYPSVLSPDNSDLLVILGPPAEMAFLYINAEKPSNRESGPGVGQVIRSAVSGNEFNE